MHPKNLKIEDFSYVLPREKIALYPAHPRDSSKLLIYNKGKITTDTYHNLDLYLPSDSALIFNDTKVVKSRILFTKSTGAVIEIFCLEPYEPINDYEILFQKTESILWKCLIGKAGKWKERVLRKELKVNGMNVELDAELVQKLPDTYVVKLSWTPAGIPFSEIMEHAGITPLPPYIKRPPEESDQSNYQTVYAEHDGSVAAPTAGLHFTGALMEKLHQKKIPALFTTLHVGAGTFKPVTSSTMQDHIMHEEWMNITTGFLENLLGQIDKTIISVGTTATRTLESIYWMGNKILNNPGISPEHLKISQWEVYEEFSRHKPQESIEALLNWINRKQLHHLLIETGIIIAPPYSFKVVKGLITNFHMPKSTLLLLVSAFMGDTWEKMYEYALRNEFRFLSYGDGCLIFPDNH